MVLPIVRTSKLLTVQQAITPVIGNDVLLLNALTIAELNAPMLIWIVPSIAEALPAFFVNGAKESADALGKIKPWQQRNIAIITIAFISVSHPKIAATNNVIPVNACPIDAILMIC